MKKIRSITALAMALLLAVTLTAPCVLAEGEDAEQSEEVSASADEESTEESSAEDVGSSDEPVDESSEEESTEESSEEPSDDESSEESSEEESSEESSEEESSEESSEEESSEESSEDVNVRYTVSIKDVDGGKYTVSDNYVGESHDRIEGISSYTFFTGSEVVITFVPDDGNKLDHVRVGGEDAEIIDNAVTFTVSADIDVDYVFDEIDTHQITLITRYYCESTGFTFLVNGEQVQSSLIGKYFKVFSGKSNVVSVVNETNPSFRIKKAELRINDETVSCEISGNEILMPPVYGNASLSIEISRPFFNVELIQTDHGTVSCSKLDPEENENVTFTFAPETGYSAKYIVINNKAIPVTDNSYVAVAVADMTVSVVFSEDNNGSTVTLRVDPSKDDDTVHGKAAFASASGDSLDVENGDAVTVIFTADPGYEIDTVKVNGMSALVDDDGKLTVAINRDTVIAVTFKVLQPRITAVVTAAGGGTITAVDKDGKNVAIDSNYVYVNYGDSITFKFTPDMNYYVSFVKVDLATVYSSSTAADGDKGDSYEFRDVVGNHTIAVSFAPEGQLLTEFTITSTSSAHGTVTPLGTQKIVQGENVTYKITPDAGYEVDYVTVDGKDVSLRDSSYTFESVSADHIISAYFKEKVQTDPTLVTVDNVDWSTASVTIDLAGKTAVEKSVIEKLASECAGRTVVFKTGDYEISFVVPGNLSTESLKLDLTSLKDENCANYQTVNTIIKSKAQYASSEFTMVNLSKFFPSGAIAKVRLGDAFKGKKVSYFTYEAGELVPSTSGNVVCDGNGWAEVTLKNYKDLVFIAEAEAATTYKVTIIAATNGVVDPSGTFEVNDGEKVKFAVIPNEGYKISKILVNGESVPVSGTKYSITPVEDTEIEVRFVLEQDEGSSKTGLIICIVIIVVAVIGGVVLFVIKWKQTRY